MTSILPEEHSHRRVCKCVEIGSCSPESVLIFPIQGVDSNACYVFDIESFHIAQCTRLHRLIKQLIIALAM